MRGKGIHYDTGTRMPEGLTRKAFDRDEVRRDMHVIAKELHCNAVRIAGSELDRLAVASEEAAAAGLEVWLSPFPCDLSRAELLELFAECASLAERLPTATLITGGELSIFAQGFLPGANLFERIAALTPENVADVPVRLNAFLGEVMDVVRPRFAGKVTYASLPFERVDWTLFDYVGADAYRSALNAQTFRSEVRALHRFGLPVVVTEFGCCTFRGAAAYGARGWMIVDRDTWTIAGDHHRDEAEQAAYFRDLMEVFEETGVDTVFWFTYAGYRFTGDLDLASYGVIRLPDRQPKEVFRAIQLTYSDIGI